ncbi:MAG: permease prefix domain 1-containing protein [Spirosomataceae bacterium]
MESINPFHLENAIQTWKNVLQKQGTLTSEDIEELSNHLEDEIDVLKKKDLSAEEAFWVAQKRIGTPMVIAEAFEKTKLNSFWLRKARTVIVIVAIGLIISSFVQILSRIVTFVFLQNGLRPFINYQWVAVIDVAFITVILGGISLSWFKREWLKVKWDELLTKQVYTLLFRLFLIVFIVWSCDAVTLFKLKIAPNQIEEFSGWILLIGWNFQIILLFLCVAFFLATILKSHQTTQLRFTNYLSTCSPLSLFLAGWIGWIMVLFLNFSFLVKVGYFDVNTTFPICVGIFHFGFSHILQKHPKLSLLTKLSLALLPFTMWCVMGLWINNTRIYEYHFWLAYFSGVLGTGLGLCSEKYQQKFKFL